MSTTAIDTVCTDAYLLTKVSGSANLERIMPKDAANAQSARQDALDRVLRRLKGLTPPINEADLTDVTELRDVVAYGALETLCVNAMTGMDGDVFEKLAKHWRTLFQTELQSLRPTVATNQRAAPFTITMHRR